MKPLLLVASLALIGSGCDQMIARFTRPIHSDPAKSSAPGEPSSVGWQPLQPGQQFAVWVHDPSLDGGCNEWAFEPTAELNNEGTLCPSFVP